MELTDANRHYNEDEDEDGSSDENLISPHDSNCDCYECRGSETSNDMECSEDSDQRTQREKDLENILSSIKIKFASLEKKDPLRMRILTIAPDHWSEDKVAREFYTTKYAVKVARKMKQKSGVMGEVCAKRGKNLRQEIVNQIKNF